MMPWEKPPVQDNPKTPSLEIPAILKRDANNVAPYMLKISPANNPPHSNPNWLPLSESKT
jgi:hypothetical protein